MQEKIDYLNYCAKGASFTNQFIETSPNIKLQVVTFSPSDKSSLPPVILLPGLASIIENFKETILALTVNHTVYFLETREKSSSIISGRVGFSIPEIATDIPVVIDKLGLENNSYILAGYSLGASVVSATYGNLKQKPLAVVLIEPSATFKWPWWLPLLARIAVPFYGVIKHFIKWYMKKFRINKEEDYEMYVLNARIIDRADPQKLAATVLSIRHFEAWEYLEHIDVSCLVIGVSLDKFHRHDEASEIAQRVHGCTFVDVLNNKRSHSAEIATLIDGFIDDIKVGLR